MKASKTINKLTKDYTEPQQQCKVTADQVTESKLTSPFLMEDLLHGVNALKNNKAAGLDDAL